MADIKNKNELKRRIELFLDELDYSINEKFCKETMQMMREFIGHTSHQLDCKNSKIDSLNKKLREYQRLEKEGLLLRLDSKDELINVLANKLFQSEFGRCYMCTNGMKNITLDGINNGCDGECNTSEEFTVEDFLKKIIAEMEYKKKKVVKEGAEQGWRD